MIGDWKNNGLCLEDGIKPATATLINLQYIYNYCLEGDTIIDEDMTKLCECGCGMEVKHGRRFINGHNPSWNKGEELSNDHKKKLSESRKGKIPWNKGKKMSDDQKKKLSVAAKIRFQDPVERKKMSNANLGHKHSDATKKKMSDAQKGREFSDDHKKKISEGLIGREVFEETRKKMSKSMKNSESHAIAMEKQRGGNDIVEHHYIYDHDDLSKYMMKVTRSKHTQIHNWMRMSGIKVPHINEAS